MARASTGSRPAPNKSGRRCEAGRRRTTSVSRQILFIQGAGAGTHDEWDDKLVESLRQMLGDGSEIR